MNGFRQSVTKATQCTPNDCKCDEQRSMHQCSASRIIITSLSMRAIAGNVDSTAKRCSSVGPQVAFSKLEQGNRCLLSFFSVLLRRGASSAGRGHLFCRLVVLLVHPAVFFTNRTFFARICELCENVTRNTGYSAGERVATNSETASCLERSGGRATDRPTAASRAVSSTTGLTATG